MTKLETPAERYNRICHLVDTSSPITYGDALFALEYVANDTTAFPELRRDAHKARRALINCIKTRIAAENGGKA